MLTRCKGVAQYTYGQEGTYRVAEVDQEEERPIKDSEEHSLYWLGCMCFIKFGEQGTKHCGITKSGWLRERFKMLNLMYIIGCIQGYQKRSKLRIEIGWSIYVNHYDLFVLQ